MHAIVATDQLSPNVTRLVLEAPRIAEIRRPGQFVIVRLGPGAERIPLTIADADPDAGPSRSSSRPSARVRPTSSKLAPGDAITDVAGPLGRPTEPDRGRARRLRRRRRRHRGHPADRPGAPSRRRRRDQHHRRAFTRMGHPRRRSCAAAERSSPCTDDGDYGRPGFVTQALADELAKGDVAAVYAVGPVPMMRAVAALTGPLGVPTSSRSTRSWSMGPGCAAAAGSRVDGVTRYACVDGPEFEATRSTSRSSRTGWAPTASSNARAGPARGLCHVGLAQAAPASRRRTPGARP